MSDLIKREDAINAIYRCFALMGSVRIKAKKALEAVPSADRPQGEWIIHFDDIWPEESTIQCSLCREHQPLGIDENFCPNCGARMLAKDTNVPNKKGADDD